VNPSAISVAIVIAVSVAWPAAGRSQEAARPREERAAELQEYIGLFVSLAQQALAHRRLASPMPCLPHWVAANDHVVVAVSAAGASAGLQRGDTLQRIGDTALTGRADGVWDVAMRALNGKAASYALAVARNGKTMWLTLPCRSLLARQFHQAERSMWEAVTQRAWNTCVERGNDMIRAFGAALSPPLMIMTRCASATTGQPHPALTNTLAHALLQEMVAHPSPSPDVRDQLLLTLGDLDAIRRAGGEDYATALRAAMAALSVDAPAFTPDGRIGGGR
jgi:hypothetical protein